jgi:hypothetical protein
MIDVFTFDSYISYSQLHFEEETLNKLTQINVSPMKAIQNIQELKIQYNTAAKPPVQARPQIPPPVHSRIPVQSNMPKLNTGIEGQRRFGMRALFM